MLSWSIEKRLIKDLKDHPKNPRKLSKEDAEHLKTSIQKFGIIDKPIITKEGLIIGGHQRKRILKEIGLKEVDCWVPSRDLTEKEVEELNVRLNKNTGEWDWDKLANEWEVTDLLEWGFILDEFDMGGDPEVVETEEDEGVLEPAKDEDAITKLGDIYTLGSHRLICGDSTDPDTVAKLLDGAEPILMVTDPPYGVEYDASWRDVAGKGRRATGKAQNDDKVNWALAWHLFPGSVAYVWSSDKFAFESVKTLVDSDYQIINQIIWVKQHFALSRGDYHSQHEPCWYAVKKGHKHNWQGARDQATTWEISNLNAFGANKAEGEERTCHSTQKPIECMARPIRNNTALGEGVYDPFLGSGTTLIACEQLGRICYGIELSPAYCDVIVGRWVRYMQKHNKPYSIKRNGEEITWEQ